MSCEACASGRPCSTTGVVGSCSVARSGGSLLPWSRGGDLYGSNRRAMLLAAAYGGRGARSAGAVGGGDGDDAGDIIPAAATMELAARANRARVRSVLDGVARRVSRDAGVVSGGSATDDAHAAAFDPSDPASMTEARWRTMSPAEQRTWVEANARDTTERNRMISGIATGAFDSIREYVRSEREQRLREIDANAQVATERIRADVERERIAADAATARARAEADRLREERLAREAEARAATDATARAEAEARARAAAEAEAAARREASDAAARSAELARAGGSGGSSWWRIAIAAVLGVLGLGGAAVGVSALMRRREAEPRQLGAGGVR